MVVNDVYPQIRKSFQPYTKPRPPPPPPPPVAVQLSPPLLKPNNTNTTELNINVNFDPFASFRISFFTPSGNNSTNNGLRRLFYSKHTYVA